MAKDLRTPLCQERPGVGWRVEVDVLGSWRPVHRGQAFVSYERAHRVAVALIEAGPTGHRNRVRVKPVAIKAAR